MTFRLRRVRSNPLARLFTWALTAALALGIPWTGVSLAAGNETPTALSVGSDPIGAQVYMDGKLRGETPLELGQVAAGEHRVTVVKDGYLENSRVVTVAARQSNSLRVNLTPNGRTSNALMQVEPEPVPPTSAPPAQVKKGGGGGKLVLIALGVAAAGAGGYLLLKPKNKAPVVSGVVANPPIALMAATPVSFNANASDPDGDTLSYTWNFGDGATGTGANPSHLYPSAGTFAVSVEVSDGKKTATATGSVTVKSMTGNWRFSESQYGPFWDCDYTLNQNGTTLTGTALWLSQSARFIVTGTVSSPRQVSFTDLWATARGEANADITVINGTDATGDPFTLTRR
jgi:hypothetical protein